MQYFLTEGSRPQTKPLRTTDPEGTAFWLSRSRTPTTHSSQNGYGPPAFSVAFTVGLTMSFTCVQTDVRRLSFRHARSYTLACPGKCVHIERLFLQLRSLFALIAFSQRLRTNAGFMISSQKIQARTHVLGVSPQTSGRPGKILCEENVCVCRGKGKPVKAKRRDIFWCWRSAWAHDFSLSPPHDEKGRILAGV